MDLKRIFIGSAISCSLLLGSAGNIIAGEGSGFSVKAGTLGIGAEISVSIVDNIRIRGGYNYLTWSFDSTLDDIEYEFEPQFNSFSAILDWHPLRGSFFFSGGAIFNNNNVAVSGTLNQGLVPSELARGAFLVDLVSISGDVEFSPVAPYLGFGWRSNNGEPGWGLTCELGVMFQGAPDVVNLRINAPIDVNSAVEVQAFLAEQEKEIEDELSKFEYYPVASLMATYTF